MSKYEPGQSGNPAGRPKGARSKLPSNQAIREEFKKNSPEALDNVIAYMRRYSDSAKQADVQLKLLRQLLEVAELEEDKDAIQEIAREINTTSKRAESASEKSLKASVKMLDFTYSIVLHEDKLSIEKKDNSPSSKQTDGTRAPVVSMKAVK